MRAIGPPRMEIDLIRHAPLPTMRLEPTHEEAFGMIAADARAGLRSAIDLILIHNERDVRGNQPRAALNPLILLLSVAAWERFVADVCFLADDRLQEVGAGPSSPGRARFLNGGAVAVLNALTGGHLAHKFEVKVFDGWVGKFPTRPRVTRGLEVGEYVDDAISHRNGVAHRSLPGAYADALWTSDANTHTVQAGWARGVAATFVQLVDQSILAIGREAGFVNVPRLPREWFIPDARRLRGVEAPGALWGGHSLVRTCSEQL